MTIPFNPEKYLFDEHSEVETSLIHIDSKVRELCKQNTCGQYGKNHMCPPAVNSLDAWREEIYAYKKALIVTKIYQTKERGGWKSWLKSMKDFQIRLLSFKKGIIKSIPENKTRLLGAGACRLCEKCTLIDNQPCLLPDKAFPSLEACGIDVMALSKNAGLKYNNGKNTITYIGAILY